MLLCDGVRRDLSDALDGKLPAWRVAVIRMHLAVCEPCEAIARSLKRTVDLLHELRDEPVPDEGQGRGPT